MSLENEAGVAFWEVAIKKAIRKEVELIVDSETDLAAQRMRERISEAKAALVDRIVERIRVEQHHHDAALRFEVVISL